MRTTYKVNVEVKIDVAKCLLVLLAIIHLLV